MKLKLTGFNLFCKFLQKISFLKIYNIKFITWVAQKEVDHFKVVIITAFWIKNYIFYIIDLSQKYEILIEAQLLKNLWTVTNKELSLKDQFFKELYLCNCCSTWYLFFLFENCLHQYCYVTWAYPNDMISQVINLYIMVWCLCIIPFFDSLHFKIKFGNKINKYKVIILIH